MATGEKPAGTQLFMKNRHSPSGPVDGPPIFNHPFEQKLQP